MYKADDERAVRCFGGPDDPLMMRYHDEEWGVPLHDDTGLLEFLLLDGAQAGLSWRTILHKREAYRAAFDGFDAGKVAGYTDADRERLLADPGIVRNRLKIKAARSNAVAALGLAERHGGLAPFFWGFVDGVPVVNRWADTAEVPASTQLSDRLSRELKRLGFKFVGSTICYSFMQAVGMVDDHTRDCFRCRPAAELRPAPPAPPRAS